MKLTPELLVKIAERVYSPDSTAARQKDYERWLMYHGATEEIIKKAIIKEFKKPETIHELLARLIPLNFTNKIITKLAGVYTQAPTRKAGDKNTDDAALVSTYEEYLKLNQIMKEANAYFKLFKRNLREYYVTDEGIPQCRNLPRHTYEVFSFSKVTPNRPDAICKIVLDTNNKDECELHVWSDESFFIVNGKGMIKFDEMFNIENPEGINSYEAMPFVYNNSSTNSCDPIPDDDLFRMSIAIPVILTDISMATKYMAWSIMYTIGNVGEVPSNPNSVLPMQYDEEGNKPEIGQIKPEVDTDKVLTMVSTLMALLLSTKSLSTGTISVKLDAQNMASGISKMLDNAESVEDKKDQQAYFHNDEKEGWELLSKYLIPHWRRNSLLVPEINREFSANFSISIYFQEPKVLITESEQIDISEKRMKAGFATKKMELKNIYPQLSDDEIDELIEELRQEKIDEAVAMKLAMEKAGLNKPAPNNEPDPNNPPPNNLEDNKAA